MRLFEIPFDPDPSGMWSIAISGDEEKQFTSRDQAMAFALSLAMKEKNEGTGDSLVCVQGADAQWRLFTSELLPAGFKATH